MYDNILHKDLLMRPGASPTAWSILQALLEKDHTRRLGYLEDFVSSRLLTVVYSFAQMSPSSVANVHHCRLGNTDSCQLFY